MADSNSSLTFFSFSPDPIVLIYSTDASLSSDVVLRVQEPGESFGLVVTGEQYAEDNLVARAVHGGRRRPCGSAEFIIGPSVLSFSL